MKKYARLRSSSSFTEQCEPCGSTPEVPTAVNLDDDFGTTAGPKSQSSGNDSSTFLDGPALPASSSIVQGEDVSKSASHRVLAEALKKLSSLRAAQHEDDSGLPQGVNSSQWVARSNFMIEVDAYSNGPASNSSTFSAGKWPRRSAQSDGAAELGGIHHSRTRSHAGVSAAAKPLGSMGLTRTESCCTHNTHFTHRRSSSMHDILLNQPPARLSPMATTHSDQHRGRAAKGGLILVPPDYPEDDKSGWSPPQLLRCSTGCSAAAAAAATAPPSRRLSTDPLQLSCHLWEEGSDVQLGTERSAANAKRATGVQSMRHDRWPGVGPAGWTVGDGVGVGKLDQMATWEGRVELQSQSVRECAAQASAIAAMAQTYAENYGTGRAGVDLECMSCGRGRATGGILESSSPSPGSSYDSSFCHSRRPPVVPAQASASAAAVSSSSTNSKKGGGAGGLSRGMMHYCRKLLLGLGKKASHKYTLI